MPEDSKLFSPFFLRMTDFLTLRFPAACQRLGCCLAKSYPGRVIERALSKYTWGGFLSSPCTCPAPVLGAAPHISPDHSPFRLREKNEARESRDMFAFPPGQQPAPCSWECPETLSTFQASVPACFLWVPPGDTTLGQEGSWRSLSLWPLSCSGREHLACW